MRSRVDDKLSGTFQTNSHNQICRWRMEVSLEKMFVDIGILRVKAAKLLKLGLYILMFDDVSKIGKARCNHTENVLVKGFT